MFVLVAEEVGPVTFLSKEDQVEEEVLVVECDAHSASLYVKDAANSVEHLGMEEATGHFLEPVNKIDLCSASHRIGLECLDLGDLSGAGW